MMRPALIFDFGNVVAHFDYRKATARLGEPLGLSGQELFDKLQPMGFSALLKQYESGQMTGETFSRTLSESIGLAIDHDDFVAAWGDIFTANESVGRLIAGLKRAGYTLILGSNTNDLHANQFRKQFVETLGHFDRLVLSYEVGHVKPSSRFYLACAEASGIEPGDCLFIDDMAENVEGATAAGLVGVHYVGTDRLIADLKALGVEPV